MTAQDKATGWPRGPGPISAGMAALVVALTPVAFLDLAGPRAATAAIDWVQVLMLGLAVWLAAHVAWRAPLQPPQRRGFALLALALLVLTVADAGWAVVDSVLGRDPSRSAINWLYIPFYPLVLAGVIAFPRLWYGRADRLRFALDVFIVALGVGLLLWHHLAQPYLPALGSASSALAIFIVVGQPLLDVAAALAVAILLLRLPTGPAARPMLWLALALTLNLLGNFVLAVQATHAEFATGGLADALWIGSRWCFLAAAESQLRLSHTLCDSLPQQQDQTSFRALPYAAVVLGYGTVLTDALGGLVSQANVIGAVVLTLALLARQAVDRREAEVLLAERERRAGDTRLAALVQHASEAILVLDDARRVAYASPAAQRLFGVAPEALQQAAFDRFLHPEEALAAAALLDQAPTPQGVRRARLRLLGADGWIWSDCTVTPLLHQPEVAGLVLNVRDISAQRELEEQLRHQSFHDPLTGLTNRLLFGERISEALSEHRGDGGVLAVMFVDLDHFKMINDGLGHGSGDAVIAEAAQRLERAVRERDVLARLGGDEFAILLRDEADDDEVVDAAQRVMAAFQQPFVVDGREIAVSASLGIAWASPGDTVDVLLRNADLALNEAKARGRGRFHVFQTDLHAVVMRKLQLHGDLRRALDDDAFSLVYQPIYRLDALRPSGVEALLRWPRPEQSDGSPIDAIAAAEESGLIVPLGRWVLERALSELAALQRIVPEAAALRLTVNLSARQLHDHELPDLIRAALARHGLEAQRLVLELTETALADEADEALAALQRLKAVGIRLALDDFGTGYSSLAQLARFPFDLLKVAKPFVDLIGEGTDDLEGARLALAVLALGESLNLETIAEGIEHRSQLELLRDAGCALGQGFLMSRPLSFDQLAQLVRDNRMFHFDSSSTLGYPT